MGLLAKRTTSFELQSIQREDGTWVYWLTRQIERMVRDDTAGITGCDIRLEPWEVQDVKDRLRSPALSGGIEEFVKQAVLDGRGVNWHC